MNTSTVLTGVRWETYESLLCDYQDRSVSHFIFDQGNLEIMSPLPQHERRGRVLEQIALAVAEARGIDIEAFGSTTFRRADLQRGFEPYGCFYVQGVGLLPDDLADLDPANLPTPDIVVETDITHASLDKLPLYAAFGVTEVWRDDGQRVTILRRERRLCGERRERRLSRPDRRGNDPVCQSEPDDAPYGVAAAASRLGAWRGK